MGNKNSVHVQPERPSYQPGEVVRGCIYVNVGEEPITSAESVSLKFTAIERTRWTKTVHVRGETEHVVCGGTNVLFKSWFPLYNIPEGVLDVGQHTFPFVFTLPFNAPASFHFHDAGGEAMIKYKLKGIVKRKGMFKGNVKGNIPLVVRPLPAPRIATAGPTGGPWSEITSKINTCFCFPQGTASCRAGINSGTYSVGDVIEAQVRAVNDTKRDIAKVQLTLHRHVRLAEPYGTVHHRIGHGISLNYEDVSKVVEESFPGRDAGEEIDSTYQLAIPHKRDGRLPPSTTSPLIQCYYSLKVRIDVAYASDAEVFLSLNITNAPTLQPQGHDGPVEALPPQPEELPPQWHSAPPPGWESPNFPIGQEPVPLNVQFQGLPAQQGQQGQSFPQQQQYPQQQQQQQQYPQQQQQQQQQHQQLYQQQQPQQQQQSYMYQSPQQQPSMGGAQI